MKIRYKFDFECVYLMLLIVYRLEKATTFVSDIRSDRLVTSMIYSTYLYKAMSSQHLTGVEINIYFSHFARFCGVTNCCTILKN